MNNLFKQIFKFGIVGFIAFLIDYSILYLLTSIVGINYLISSGISFTISLIFNYIASTKYVFNTGHKQEIKDVIIFAFLSIIGLGINELIMFIGVDKFNINYLIVKIFATAIVMVYNFITRKIFIEKK
jgi:putative flippase GtrA